MLYRESVEKFMIAQIGCVDVAAVGMVKRVKLHQHYKFVAIGPTVAETWRFVHFSPKWQPPAYWIFKILNF